MANVIPQEIPIDQKLASRLISGQFSIDCEEMHLLGEGWDNLVFLVNGEWIFRFPRREIAVPLLRREINVLSNIHDKIGIAMPDPEFIGKPVDIFPYPFYGHRMIVGDSGCKIQLSAEQQLRSAIMLAEALKKLHHLEFAEFLGEDDLSPIIDRLDYQRLSSTFHERFVAITDRFSLSKYEKQFKIIVDNAAYYDKKDYSPCLVHGDLYFRHLLFNDGKLSGIIDWGDSCINQRVLDLGVVFQYFDGAAQEVFWSHYGTITKDEQSMAMFIALYLSITLLWYGDSIDDIPLVKTSLNSLLRIAKS